MFLMYFVSRNVILTIERVFLLKKVKIDRNNILGGNLKMETRSQMTRKGDNLYINLQQPKKWGLFGSNLVQQLVNYLKFNNIML
jgi:hypothetical protein